MGCATSFIPAGRRSRLTTGKSRCRSMARMHRGNRDRGQRSNRTCRADGFGWNGFPRVALRFRSHPSAQRPHAGAPSWAILDTSLREEKLRFYCSGRDRVSVMQTKDVHGIALGGIGAEKGGARGFVVSHPCAEKRAWMGHAALSVSQTEPPA
jgi:hypothetical protein